MKQSSYDAIFKCIKLGAPALFDELVTELNETIQIALKEETKTTDKPKEEIKSK